MNADLIAQILKNNGYDETAIGIIAYGKKRPDWTDYIISLGHDKDTIQAVREYGGLLEPEADQ